MTFARKPRRSSASADSDRADPDRPRPERPPRPPRPPRDTTPRPIDAAQLQELALGYAARYATTAAKLRRYLERKLQTRAWTPADPPDIEALVVRIAGLGYVDDRAFAASKSRDLAARGFGTRRIRAALSAAGVDRDDSSAALAPDDDAPANPHTSAIAFARRRRFGPFARDPVKDPARDRSELAAMARAGHDFDVAKRVLTARDEAAALALGEED